MSETRRNVLNADRASNAEMPASAAVAQELTGAKIRRGMAADATSYTGKDLQETIAREHLGKARGINAGDRPREAMQGTYAATREARAEAAKQMTANDYWAAKVARGAGRAEGVPAQAQEHKEGARRGMAQRAG